MKNNPNWRRQNATTIEYIRKLNQTKLAMGTPVFNHDTSGMGGDIEEMGSKVPVHWEYIMTS